MTNQIDVQPSRKLGARNGPLVDTLPPVTLEGGQ